MKPAMRWVLAFVYLSVGWKIIGSITTESTVQVGLFSIFACSSALISVLGRRVIASSSIGNVGADIKPAHIEPAKDVREQKTKDVVGAPSIRNVKVEYPYRLNMPGDEPQRVVTSPSNEFKLPSNAPLTKIEKQSIVELKQFPVSNERLNSPRVERPKPLPKQKRTLDPDHYRRHTGVPGYLYIARNDFHQIGLHKIGYTTLTPAQRIKTLNQEHSYSSDVGNFSLVHSVQVGGSYDAEQALFDAIAESRAVAKREYFFERSEFLIKALQSASVFNNGNPDALNDFLDWSLDQDSWRKYLPPPLQEATVPPKLKSTDGWIYAARNPWHRDSIFRIGMSKNNPQIKVDELNQAQRQLTCQIGFYKLVECEVVGDHAEAFNRFKKLIHDYKIPGSRAFFDVPLPTLREALAQATREGERCNRVSAPLEFTDQILVDIVPLKPHPSWVAWTGYCSTCGQLLRFRGAIASAGLVVCPACGGQIRCRIGASKVEFPG